MTSRRDKPITCKPYEVRALLAGRKTMHRVALKGRDAQFIDNLVANYLAGRWNERPMPYAVGDRLWVREKWIAHGTGVWSIADARRRIAHDQQITYAATAEGDHASGPWWSSSQMPREFSRLTLIVTAVKVERLQSISNSLGRKPVVLRNIVYRPWPQHRRTREGGSMTSRRHASADRIAKARRQRAIQRPELRQPSAPRVAPAGPTSPPIKTVDPALRRMIDDAARDLLGRATKRKD